MGYCDNCGHLLRPGAKFCPSCATSVVGLTRPAHSGGPASDPTPPVPPKSVRLHGSPASVPGGMSKKKMDMGTLIGLFAGMAVVVIVLALIFSSSWFKGGPAQGQGSCPCTLSASGQTYEIPPYRSSQQFTLSHGASISTNVTVNYDGVYALYVMVPQDWQCWSSRGGSIPCGYVLLLQFSDSANGGCGVTEQRGFNGDLSSGTYVAVLYWGLTISSGGSYSCPGPASVTMDSPLVVNGS